MCVPRKQPTSLGKRLLTTASRESATIADLFQSFTSAKLSHDALEWEDYNLLESYEDFDADLGVEWPNGVRALPQIESSFKPGCPWSHETIRPGNIRNYYYKGWLETRNYLRDK